MILASASPRRHQLLRDLGFTFDVVVREVDESFPTNLSPTETVLFIAQKKAAAYLDLIQDHIVITADTIVANAGEILGKPADAAEAATMIRSLSGGTHEVISAVVIAHQDQQIAFAEQTKVVFRDLSESEIQHYVETSRPYDKAGSYGIQEWIGMIGITAIHGDYYNVMGLPTSRLYQALHTFNAERTNRKS